MVKKNLFLAVRPKVVWLIITFVLFFSTAFLYVFREQESKLRCFTQDRLIAALEDSYLLQTRLLDAVNAKNQVEAELRGARDELQRERDELRRERTARDEVESRLTIVMKENEELKATVSLDRIVVKKTGEITRVRRNKTISISLGTADNLQKGDTLSVYRNGSFIGKAKVSRVKRSSSTASILSDTEGAGFKKGDEVRVEK